MSTPSEQENCPSHETLAAFIGGRLDSESQRRVTAHMTACTDCGSAVLTAQETRAKTTAPRSFRTGPAAVVILAAATLLLVLQGPRRVPSDMDRLVAVSKLLRYRPSLARLSADFPYRDVVPIVRGEARVELPATLSAISDALEVKGESESQLHALGVARLLTGDALIAVRTIERAVMKQSDAQGGIAAAIRRCSDAALLNDLAAAYVTLIERKGDAAVRPLALEAAERAWSLEKTPAIAWTRAVVIESFHVRERSIAAWRDALALESQSEWSDVARRHLHDAEEPTDAELWPSVRGRLSAMPLDNPDLRRLVDRFRQDARLWCEDELLPQWGAAVLRGDPTAASLLRRIEALGRALPESEVVDAVHAIRRASPDALPLLARGHIAFGAGRLADRNAEAAEAVRDMDAAVEALTPQSTPFALRAHVEHAAVVYLSNDYPRARGELESLPLDSAPLACQAKAHALLGIIALHNGAYKEAADHYVRSIAAFRKVGERDYEATMISRLAAAMEFAGDETQARDYREQALELLDRLGDPKHRHDAMLEAAYVAMGKDQQAVADLFLDSLVALDTSTRKNVVVCATLMRRCDYRYRRGLIGAATSDLHDAQRVCRSISDPGVRERQLANLEIAESALNAAGSPTEALAGLDDAIAYYSRTKSHVWLPTAYFARARVLEPRDPAAAERDFHAALDETDAMRDQLDERKVRMSFTATTDEIVDGYVEFLLRQRRGHDAFEVADRYRVRELVDSPSARWRVVTPGSTLEQLQATLPASAALVEYRVLRSSIVAWVATPETFTTTTLRGSLDDLQAALGVLDGNAEESALKAATTLLYERLMRAIEPSTKGVSTLVIVPDDDLERVPYSGLYDQRAGQYAFQTRATVVAPSAALFVQSEVRAHDRAGDDRLVVIQAGTGDGSYAALPRASSETRRLERMYRDTRVVTETGGTGPAILAQAGDATLLQFVGHTTVDGDGSSPALRLGAKGQVGMADILAAPLARLRLVYLSACETDNGPVLKSEGSVTIARSFFAAGVPVVVGTLWPVDDSVAEIAARAFHEHLRNGDTPAEALRQAQLEVRLHSQPSSVDWAAFRVIGAGI